MATTERSRMQMPGGRYVERFLAETAFHRAMAAHTPDLMAADTVTMDVALGPPDETPWIELELGR
jgi:hypothetical protein